jgi:hypothetical protein
MNEDLSGQRAPIGNPRHKRCIPTPLLMMVVSVGVVVLFSLMGPSDLVRRTAGSRALRPGNKMRKAFRVLVPPEKTKNEKKKAQLRERKKKKSGWSSKVLPTERLVSPRRSVGGFSWDAHSLVVSCCEEANQNSPYCPGGSDWVGFYDAVAHIHSSRTFNLRRAHRSREENRSSTLA